MKRLLTLLFVATLWVGCLSQGDGTGIRNSREGYLAEIANEGPVQAETIGEIVGEDFTRQVVDEDVLRKHYHQEAL